MAPDPLSLLFARRTQPLAWSLLGLGVLVVVLAWFLPSPDHDRDRGVLIFVFVLLMGAYGRICRIERNWLRIGVAWLVSFGLGWATTTWGARGTYAITFLPTSSIWPVVAGVAVVRALAVSPLVGVLRASSQELLFDAEDALDRVLLPGSLWLNAVLFEVCLVAIGTRRIDPHFSGVASWVVDPEGWAFGLAFAMTLLLALATALSALWRARRWQRLWGRVVRGEGLRLVEARGEEPLPLWQWFEDFGPSTRVVLFEGEHQPEVYREKPARRAAVACAPEDASRVTRGLRQRLVAAGVLVVLDLVAIVAVAVCCA